MKYNNGDIIEKKGLVFKDDFTPDPKGSRPSMIAVAVTEDKQYTYFLTLSSKVDKYYDRIVNRDCYFLVKKSVYNMLKSTSVVNLKNIYKMPLSNERPVAFIQPHEYKKLIRKLIKWQETSGSQDEYYEELKTLL